MISIRFRPYAIAALACLGFFATALPGYAEEALGTVRGRIVDGSGMPIAGIKVSIKLGETGVSDAVTGEDGSFTLQAYLGRRSLKMKPGLNLFGITTKIQFKVDIRVSEIDIDLEIPSGKLRRITVPVFFADLDRYVVYLCDVERSANGELRWLKPDLFKLAPLAISSDIIKPDDELIVEAPVSLPPFPELVARLRVVLLCDVFKDGALKAFDDGKKADQAKGDGVYTASFELPKKGPFGFYLISARVELPPLSAVFEPGQAWPLMVTTIQTTEAGGHIKRVTQVYSIGGIETGLSAEWYYFDRDDSIHKSMQSYEEDAAKHKWYGLYARGKLAEGVVPLFACRGMVEFRAASAMKRMIGYYEEGDLQKAGEKLEDARKLSPDYESIPLWEARLKYAKGDLDGAIAVIEKAIKKRKLKGLNIIIAELYRERGSYKEAVETYIAAFNETGDLLILRTVAYYLYELGEYEAAQQVYDYLKYYAESVPYTFGFLMHAGGYDFGKRFNSTSKVAEQLLYKDYAAPSDVWTRAIFEEAFIYGSLCGWKEQVGNIRTKKLAPESAKKYSVVLRLAGELDEAERFAATIPGNDGELELGIIALERTLSQPELSVLDTVSVTTAVANATSDAVESEAPQPSASIANDGFAAALQHFAKVIESDDENFDAVYLSALTHFLQGDYAAAYEFLTKALELEPSHQEVRFMAARALEALGKPGESVPHWQWFVDELPDSAAKIIAGEHLLNLKSALGLPL